jgi:hypothetical protein
VTDFESTVKRLLNEQVDVALGPRRPAPRLELPAAATRRGFRPWVAPLAIAACVVAALIATLTSTNVLSEHRAATPVSTPPAPTVVQLMDARIWLPPGWHATVSSDTPSAGRPPVFGNQSTTWCLGPAGKGGTDATCRAWLERAGQEPTHGNVDSRYDSDIPGGTPHTFQQVCPYNEQGGWSVVEAEDRNFGGRTADYRVFQVTCDSSITPSETYTQYLVPAGPAFALYARSSDNALRVTMAEIAQRSSLPKQTTALRYYDHGFVRGVKSVAGDRIQLTIDRVAIGPNGPINDDPRTYQYYVPTFVWRISNVHLAVGDVATVQTDGTTVFEVYQTPV